MDAIIADCGSEGHRSGLIWVIPALFVVNFVCGKKKEKLSTYSYINSLTYLHDKQSRNACFVTRLFTNLRIKSDNCQQTDFILTQTINHSLNYLWRHIVALLSERFCHCKTILKSDLVSRWATSEVQEKVPFTLLSLVVLRTIDNFVLFCANFVL